MCPDKSDIHKLRGVLNNNHSSVIVAFEIENIMLIADIIG